MRILAGQMGIVGRNIKLHARYVAMNVLWAASAVSMACFDTLGVHFESHNNLVSIFACPPRCFSPSQDYSQVIVDKISWLPSDR